MTAPSSDPSPVVLAGTPYRLVRQLGRGSMGEVFEAVHTDGSRVAIKVLAAHLAHRADVVRRMQTEARVLSEVRHKNLVRVFDIGMSADGRLYFVMELLEGHTLRRTIDANAPMRPSLALDLAIRMLEGLGAAHDAGIVHRDVKPENVFVCATGEVKLLDFGVAKVGQTAATMTKTGFSIGTPRYMAPEQVEGKPVDARTDLYAAGTLLFELLTRTVPFEDKERLALAFSIVTKPPPPPSERTPALLSPRLDAAVLRALAKTKEERFQDAREMIAALRASQVDSLGTAARSSTASSREGSVDLREEPVPGDPLLASLRTFLVLMIAALVVASAIGIIVIVTHAHHAAPAPSAPPSAPTPATSGSAPPPATGAAATTVPSAIPSAAPSTPPASAAPPPHAAAHAPRPHASAGAAPSNSAPARADEAGVAPVRRPGSGL